MQKLYGIGQYDSCEHFLYLKARRFGNIGRGGIPDIFTSARSLVEDWNRFLFLISYINKLLLFIIIYFIFRGKIRYHTLPPEDETVHLSAQIVSNETDVFNLDNVQRVETEFMEELAKLQPESGGAGVKTESMDVDGKSMVVVDDGVQAKKTGKLRWRKKKKSELTETKIDIQPGVIKLKKLQKANAKKKRKTAARLIKCEQLLDKFAL